MQRETPVSLDLSPSAAPNGKLKKMRLGSLRGKDRQQVFDAVIEIYITGPKLEDIARDLGVGHRSLQRFMTSHNRKDWLEAQWWKQYDRVDGKSWKDHLFNSAGYRMDKIDAERRKLNVSPVTLVTQLGASGRER